MGGTGGENPRLGICSFHTGREGRAPRLAQSLCCYPLDVTVPLFLCCQPRTASLGPQGGDPGSRVPVHKCGTGGGHHPDPRPHEAQIPQQVLSVTAQETRVQGVRSGQVGAEPLRGSQRSSLSCSGHGLSHGPLVSLRAPWVQYDRLPARIPGWPRGGPCSCTFRKPWAEMLLLAVLPGPAEPLRSSSPGTGAVCP